MTTAAICATREVSWSPSFYRGEQYDSDLGLYYLRARYYNPNTGRFLSRDQERGKATNPASLHKYLYADGDPVNAADPTGNEAFFAYAALLKNRATVAATFGTKTDMCLIKALRGLADVLSAVLSGSSIPVQDQDIGAQLGACEANAIKGLLGMLLSHV
jgi:RHS repeat-associated protein